MRLLAGSLFAAVSSCDERHVPKIYRPSAATSDVWVDRSTLALGEVRHGVQQCLAVHDEVSHGVSGVPGCVRCLLQALGRVCPGGPPTCRG
jgi:hypothetical protein